VDSPILQSHLIQINLGVVLPIIIKFLHLHIFCYLLDRLIAIQVFFKILKIVKNITSKLLQSLSCQLTGLVTIRNTLSKDYLEGAPVVAWPRVQLNNLALVKTQVSPILRIEVLGGCLPTLQFATRTPVKFKLVIVVVFDVVLKIVELPVYLKLNFTYLC